MILLEDDMFDGLDSDDGLATSLQSALELEHATIPTYLYAYYSLAPELNTSVSNLIRSVVMDEMGHMALVCNLMNALGMSPRLDDREFVPSFPSPLPGSIQTGLQVQLAPFSKDLVCDVFMEIEEPEFPLDFDVLAIQAAPRTIGQFYAAIAEELRSRGPNAIVGNPQYQIGSGASGLPNIVAITDLDSALKAIETIVEQGEGTSQSPEVDPDDPALDLAHYYKFAMIYHGRRLIRNPDAGPDAPPRERYIYGGQPIAVDEGGIFPLPTNPKAADFDSHPETRAVIHQFNIAYTTMLRTLHQAANGSPTLVGQASATMKNELRPLALQLVSAQLPDGTRAAPTFEYQEPPTGTRSPSPRANERSIHE